MDGWALAFIGLSYGAHSNLCINQIRRWANAEQKARYLPGRIIAVDVAPGSAVTKGTKLLTLKAMKMEHGRTVTETDNLLFSVMTHDPQLLHIDAEAAKASAFAQILVNGTFTFALMIGLSVSDTTLGALIANPGYDKLLMPRPAFLGRAQRSGGTARKRLVPGGGTDHLPP